MNPPALPNSGFRIRKLHVVLMLLLALPLFSVLGIASYFWLGTETKALRASVMANSTGHWHKKFAGNVGGFTTAVIRFGSRFFHLPPEARAGLDSLRSGECGVFELEGEPASTDRAAVLLAADKAMTARGWVRVVGVVQPDSLVAVYLPKSGLSPKSMKAAVLVLNEHELVVALARGNIKPLMQIAHNHLPKNLPPLLL